MGATLELREATKLYGSVRALDNVSITLPEGAVGLLGPNGAGKSTLVKAILGLVTLNQGHGKVLGLDIRTQRREIRQVVGYVPEDDCYVVGLTGIEAVRLMGELGGLPSREALRRGHEILDHVGILEERYREVQTYSTGMKQKIKLAQALIHDPKLLILDEPTNGLDPEMRIKVLNLIKALCRKKNIQIILSTHLLRDVERVCNYVVILGKGRVLAQDELAALQKPSDPGYHVRFHGPGDALTSLLQKEGFTVEREASDTIQVRGNQDAPNAILRAACQCGVQVRQIQPGRNSLEDYFLKAVPG